MGIIMVEPEKDVEDFNDMPELHEAGGDRAARLEFDCILHVAGHQRLSMRGAVFEDGIRVDSIGEGPLEDWNKANPDRRISSGDMIVSVNNAQVFPGMKLIDQAVDGKLRLRVTKRRASKIEDGMEIIFEDESEPPVQQRLLYRSRPMGFVVKNRLPIVVHRCTGKGPHADRLREGMKMLSFNGVDVMTLPDWAAFLEQFSTLTSALPEYNAAAQI